MAVAYESDGGTVFCNANNNNAVTVTLPATRPTGSVLYCVIFNRLITSSVTTAPSGYTLLSAFPKTSGTASGGRIWVYARVVDGSESNPSVACDGTTGNSGDLWGACIFCYSGVDTSGTLDGTLDGTVTTTDAAGTTTCTYPAITISNTDSMVVRFLARFRDAVDTFTPTATWNEREDAGSTTRTGGQLHLQDKLATASGSQASVTVAPSNTTSSRYLAVSMALKAQAAQSWSRTPSETVTAADARSLGFGKAVADPAGAADSQTLGWTLDRRSDNPVAVTDSFSRVVTYERGVSDSALTADVTVVAWTLDRATDNPVGVTDQATFAVGKALADGVAVGDSVDPQLTSSGGTSYSRSPADTVTASDAQQFDRSVSIADNVGAADAAALGFGVNLADGVGCADGFARAAGFSRAVQDTAGVADVFANQLDYVRTVADLIGVADSATAESNAISAFLDPIPTGRLGGSSRGSLGGTERGAARDHTTDGTSGGLADTEVAGVAVGASGLVEEALEEV